MPSTNRISVTTASATHQKLLEYEAALTGRSISSIASSLLEEILNTKLNEGKLHPTAVRLAEELVKAREHSLKTDHESELVTLHGEAYKLEREWEKILSHLELPSTVQLLRQQAQLKAIDSDEVIVGVNMGWLGMVQSRKDLLEKAIHEHTGDKPQIHLQPIELIDGSNRGYFTDGVWAENPVDTGDSFEDEMVKYGMSRGLNREHAEDIYEKYQGQPRYRIREEMRAATGAPVKRLDDIHASIDDIDF